MENFIAVFIIAALALLGILYTVKHFRGEGGCCGGGSYKPKRKKLSDIKYTKKFKVSGMHCEHCKRRVEEAVNDIKGVAGRVNLKTGELTVSYAETVEDRVISERLSRAGYTVTDVR